MAEHSAAAPITTTTTTTTTSSGNGSKVYFVHQPLDLQMWSMLPTELLMEIFKYCSRDYIPDYMWASQYFINRWRQLHVTRSLVTPTDSQHIHRLIYEDNRLIREQKFMRWNWSTSIAGQQRFYDNLNSNPNTRKFVFATLLTKDTIFDYHYKQYSVCYTYTLNGQLMSSTCYCNGKKDGVEINYYPESGLVKDVTNYRHDQKTGLSIHCLLNDNGDIDVSYQFFTSNGLQWYRYNNGPVIQQVSTLRCDILDFVMVTCIVVVPLALMHSSYITAAICAIAVPLTLVLS